MNALILFDIDATLLLTGGAGVAAMGDAGRTLFGPTFTTEGTDFAGRIDPLLFRELFERNGIKPTTENFRVYRETYRNTLEREMAVSTKNHALPGTHELVLRLREMHAAALGLLTGNFPETGAIKLQRCGFDPAWFPLSVWGDDSPKDPPSRDDLPEVAFERFATRFGARPEPSRVTIIGDTPHDVQCAKANGCRSLAVGTGKYSVDELQRAGADRAVPDLSKTDDLARWLLAV